MAPSLEWECIGDNLQSAEVQYEWAAVKWSSVNYPAALTTLKLKRCIHGGRGKFLYRKAPLYVKTISLKRKPRVN